MSNSNEKLQLIDISVIVVVSALLFGVIALCCISQRSIGTEIGRKAAYMEAVKAGSARWGFDEKGEPKIEWIVPLEKKSP